MKRHKCGFKPITVKHLVKLVAPMDVASEARPEEPTGLGLSGLAACLQECDCIRTFNGISGKVSLSDIIVGRQRRVVRSRCSVAFNGLVDGVEQIMRLHVTLHKLYGGISQSPEVLIDMLEQGRLYPPFDISADVRAACDAIPATDACEPAGSSFKLHLISARDQLEQGIIRNLYWADTRDMLADGLTKGRIDRAFIHNVSDDCRYKAIHVCVVHIKSRQVVGSATDSSKEKNFPTKEEFQSAIESEINIIIHHQTNKDQTVCQ